MSQVVSKQKVYELLVSEIVGNINRLTQGYESVSDAAAKAQGRMESRYDTIKEEQSKLADSIGMGIYDQKERLRKLQYFWATHSQPGQIVGPGSMVTVESGDGEETYFILESAGGRIITLDDCEVICISVETPVAQYLLGHRQGEIVEVQFGKRSRQLTIKFLQ